jgi:hypothetical protein
MKTLLAAAAAAVLLTATTAAFAKPADANGDGRISLEEMQHKHVAKVMRFDRDGDGRISHAEYAALLQHRAQRHPGRGGKDRFARLDLNHDGYVTPDEVNQVVARHFGRRDPSHTGYIPADQTKHGAGAAAGER